VFQCNVAYWKIVIGRVDKIVEAKLEKALHCGCN